MDEPELEMEKLESNGLSTDLIEVQKKFAASLIDFANYARLITDYLSDFKDYLQSWRALFGDTRDLMQEQVALHRESLEAYKALAKAITESHVSASENNERMEKLITKVESYFGDGTGLEHEN